MTRGAIRRGWLKLLQRTLNPITLRSARRGVGPFSLVRHVGRTTGTVYETPLLLAEAEGGLVAELTYGADVAWYRNIVAAGGCTVVHRGREVEIDRIEPLDTAAGMAAFGPPRNLVLKLLRRHEFRYLHVADPQR